MTMETLMEAKDFMNRLYDTLNLPPHTHTPTH